MSDTNKQIVEQVNTAFAENKLEDFYALCTAETEWTMAGGKPVKGVDAIREFMGSMGGEDCGIPSFDVSAIISEGDQAVCNGTMSMTYKGEPQTHWFADIYRIRGGKIATLISFVVPEQGEGETAAAA